MQKESLLFFSFSSESTFGGAKVRISENNKNKFVFLLQSRTKVLSAEPKIRISEQNAKEKSRISIPFSFFIIIFA